MADTTIPARQPAGSGASVELRGVAAAPGVARGPWRHVVRTPLPAPGHVPAEAVADEVARLREAAKASSADLRALAASVREAGHPDEAAIFLAHAAMARD